MYRVQLNVVKYHPNDFKGRFVNLEYLPPTISQSDTNTIAIKSFYLFINTKFHQLEFLLFSDW